MNDSSIERDIYFFMAYLARHASDLGFEIPLDRDAYRLVEPTKGGGHHHPSLCTEIRLADDVMLPIQTGFAGPFDSEDLDRLAEELVEDLTEIEDERDELVDEIRELRIRAEQAFNERKNSNLKFKSIELDTRSYRRDRRQYILTYEKLGEDTKPCLRTTYVVDGDDIDGELAAHREEQKGLLKRGRQYAKENADGAIDAVLVSRLERYSIDPFSIIKFAEELDANDVVQTPEGDLRLFWKDGVLTASFFITPEVEWHGGLINFRNGPDGQDGELAGRKVSELLDHADIPSDLTFVAGTAKVGKPGSFHAELNYFLFDTKSNVIW